MIQESWIDKISNKLEGVKLNQEAIDNMRTLEWLVEGGKARVLACIIKAHKTGIRYTELLKITKIPNTNLSRILGELKRNEIIHQENVKVKEPRKDVVPMYFYNSRRFGSSISYMFDCLIAISRDQIQSVRDKMK